MSKEIPGFYFDQEKGKYFRLLTGNRHYDGSFHNATTSSHQDTKLASISNNLKKNGPKLKKFEKRAQKFELKCLSTSDSIVKSIALNQLIPDLHPLQIPLEQLIGQRFEQIKQLERFVTRRVCHRLLPLPEKNLFIGTWENGNCFGNSSLMALKMERFENNLMASFGRCQGVDEKESCTAIDCVPKSIDDHCLLYCSIPKYRNQRIETKLKLYRLDESGSSTHRPPMIDCCSLDVKESSLCISAHSNNRCAVGFCGRVETFQAYQTQLVSTHKFLTNKNNQVNDLAFKSDGQTLLCVGSKTSITLIDLRADQMHNFKINNNTTLSTQVQWLPNRVNEFIVGGMNHRLELFDVRQLSRQGPLLKFMEHKNSSSRICFSVDSELDLVGCNGDDYQLRIWSTRNGGLIHQRSIQSLGLTIQSPDQLQLVIGGRWNCMKEKESWIQFWAADDHRVSYFGMQSHH